MSGEGPTTRGEVTISEPRPDETKSAARGAATGGREVRLSTKLIALTALFVVQAEVLVFVPSIAHFRVNRLQEMTQRAELVALALEATPDVDRSLQDRLLQTMGASTIAARTGDMRSLIDEVVDLGQMQPWTSISQVLSTLAAGDGRTIRVIGAPDAKGTTIDVVMSETPMRQATLSFAGRLLAISAAILMVVAVMVFLGLPIAFAFGLATFGFAWMIYPALWPILGVLYTVSTLGGPDAATPGMKAMGLSMRTVDGPRPDTLKALIHVVVFYALTATLSPLIHLAGLFTSRRQLIQDMLVGVVVMDARVLALTGR